MMLERFVHIRSRVAEELLQYLDGLAWEATALPPYYPAHLRTAETGRSGFEAIRQQVHVVEDRPGSERWLAEERERLRAAGPDVDRLAYGPARARPGTEEGAARPAPTHVPWDVHTAQRFRRAVILGDPGFGKTWFLRYEASRIAREAGERLRGRTLAMDDLTVPILVRLIDLNRSDAPVEEALVAHVGTGRSVAFRRFVQEKLASDRCVVLLDGWDEVPVECPPPGQRIAHRPHHRQRLGQRLEAFARLFPKPRLLLTSRIVGYTGSPIPGAHELELLAFDRPQVEEFVRVWFRRAPGRGERFLAILRENPQVGALARIPLMLTLLCWAYQEGEPAFPTRRVELYQRCLRGFLQDWRGERERRHISPAYVEAMSELLEDVALDLFDEGYEQFDEALLQARIRAWHERVPRPHELGDRDPAALMQELKGTGVLVTSGEHPDAALLFLERTLHEHLAARALARRANREGWEAIAPLLDRRAWDPAWHEVIVLLAGGLTDPTPLLKMLSNPGRTPTNPHGDDLFRHRLALAALCLPEIDPAIRNSQCAIVDDITTFAFSLWWEHRMKHTVAAVAHLTRALPALGQVNGRVEGMPLLEWLAQQVERPAPSVRTAAVRAVGGLGPAATTLEFLARLFALLGDGDADVRRAAAEAVGGLGAAAATSVILARLTELLRDEDRDVRAAAVRAVGSLGPAATTPEVLALFADLLRDRADPRVREAAARAVGSLGQLAATPPILARLADVLGDEDRDVRAASAEALAAVGTAAATPDLLSRLIDLQDARDAAPRTAAALAVRGLGTTAATPDILARLLDLLDARSREVQVAAAAAVRGFTSPAAGPALLIGLAELLRDEARDVRTAAAEAVGGLMNRGLRFFGGMGTAWESKSVAESSWWESNAGGGLMNY